MSVNGKLVVVTGATGAQGGGVVDAVRASTNAKIRAITRNPSSTKAKDLSSRGVEVVAGDLDDKASLVKVSASDNLGQERMSRPHIYFLKSLSLILLK
jgi:nucleoside-diphosphate-sugar epimerase